MSSPRGLIQVYTGDGKGKTTAALGLAVRAAGAGLKVAIVYFDKGGTHYSERTALTDRFKGAIDFWATGLDRIDPKTGKFRFGVTPEDKAEAERGLCIARHLLAKPQYDLVVLDEINTTVSLGMLNEEAVAELVKTKPRETEVVMTGRHCPEMFMDMADLVSEVRPVKHYFEEGVAARRGFDY